VDQITSKRTITADQLSSSVIADDEVVKELNFVRNDKHWNSAGKESI
jgi:hypothetical protein